MSFLHDSLDEPSFHEPTCQPRREPVRKSVAVALGGGSARGYAHIGALASLERHGLSPDALAGASFGAVVAVLYALSEDTRALERTAVDLRRRDVLPRLIDFGLHRGALFAGDRLERYFDDLTNGRTFADLKRPVVVVATDADSGERVALREGSLARALRASAALPGIFAPVEVDGRRLIDGGVGSPVPIDMLGMFDVDLRVGIGAGTDATESRWIRHVVRAIDHPWGERVHAAMARARAGSWGSTVRSWAWTAEGYRPREEVDRPGHVEVHTRPPIHWLRFDAAREAIAAGEAALERLAPSLRATLDAVAPAP